MPASWQECVRGSAGVRYRGCVKCSKQIQQVLCPHWGCVSINHTIAGGHHLNMAHSFWLNPIYYVLLACEIPKCRINHGILHWGDWYCISERLTIVSMKYHSQTPTAGKNCFKICHISPKDPYSSPKLSQPDIFGTFNTNKIKIMSRKWQIDVILQTLLTGKTSTFTYSLTVRLFLFNQHPQ